MLAPPVLKRGDKIGIVSTARKITVSEIKPALDKIHSWGFEIATGKNLFNEYNQFAGTDAERAADFQDMLHDGSVKAILCARGGYGTIRIIDKIDFTGFAKKPKWLIGFSDVTVLHSYFHHVLHCETIHAAMPVNFPANGIENETTLSLHRILNGGQIKYEIPAHPLNITGCTDGELVGGNLSILYSLRGTPWDIDTSGKVLFIEDLDEYLYHVDRMMMNLKHGGKLNNLKGLIVGAMTEMKDNTVPFGKNAYEIIYDAVKEYNYPVLFDFPAGHVPVNHALVFGRKARLVVGENPVVNFS